MKTLKALLLLAVVLSLDHSVTAGRTHIHLIQETFSGDVLRRTALWQFRNIMLCYMPKSWPIRDYSNYGCYCGKGGKGEHVDETDRCCRVHDKCYGEVQNHPHCSSYVWKSSVPYIRSYKYTCNEWRETAKCSSENDKCMNVLCECDREAGQCFARSTYNNDHWRMDQTRCK